MSIAHENPRHTPGCSWGACHSQQKLSSSSSENWPLYLNCRQSIRRKLRLWRSHSSVVNLSKKNGHNSLLSTTRQADIPSTYHGYLKKISCGSLWKPCTPRERAKHEPTRLSWDICLSMSWKVGIDISPCAAWNSHDIEYFHVKHACICFYMGKWAPWILLNIGQSIPNRKK